MKLVLEKRLRPSRTIAWIVPVVSFVLALIFGGIVLAAAGANPIEAYAAMWDGAFGSSYALSEVLVKAIPLALTGLAVGIAFKMLFWNIGAEGQLVMGGFAASGVALFVVAEMENPTPWLALPMMALAAIAAGAAWGLIPAVLKARLGVNEIITTLLLNYVAILWVQHLYYGPWRDPAGFGFPGTAMFPDAAWLPRFPGTRVHYGLFIALIAALGLWFVLERTKWGYEIKVVGENSRAARYAGISIARNILLVMVLSGGLAGLAGMTEVAGISRRLMGGLIAGYGFTAIIVAWLARLNPWAILLVAFLLAGLIVGGDQLQITMRLPAAVAQVIQGSILFFMLGGTLFVHYRVRLVRSPREALQEVRQGQKA